MLMLHYGNRHLNITSSRNGERCSFLVKFFYLPDAGEENVFFLLHVLYQFFFQLAKQLKDFCQFGMAATVFCCNLFQVCIYLWCTLLHIRMVCCNNIIAELG